MLHSPSHNSDAYSSSSGNTTAHGESPYRPTSKLAAHPRASISRSVFVCTICWQHQPSGSKPKLLGTSARIVCRACWRAVLDLSICWVCGECVVRGDEVVSLGWCFWHRECFGCLACRTRMNLSGIEHGNVTDPDPNLNARRGEWGGWKNSRDVVNGRRRGTGVELDTIPLCSACCVETASESRDQILERGLESVPTFDGGLSRDRLDISSEESGGEITLVSRILLKDRRLKAATGIEQDLKRHINSSSVRCVSIKLLRSKGYADISQTNDLLTADDMSASLDNAADMEISDGGTHNKQRLSDGAVTKSGEFQQEKQQPDLYISVFDPVGEPAFKPSETKPLPRWMHLLPNNVYREREQKANAAVDDGSVQFHRLDSPIEDFSIAGKPFDSSYCELGVPLQSPKAFQANSLSFEGPRGQLTLKGPSAFSSCSLEYLDKYEPGPFNAKKQIYKTPLASPILDRIKSRKAEKYNMVEGAEEITKKTVGNRSKRLRLGSEEYGIDPRREDLRKELRNLFCEE